jgi:methyl-accepting chemotaxis protein
MKTKKFISLKRKLGIIVGIGITITALLLISYTSFDMRHKAIEFASSNAQAQAQDFATKISLDLETAISSSRSLANAISAVGNSKNPLKISRAEAIKMGEKVLFSNANFLGFTFAFEPNAFDGLDKKYRNTFAHDQTGRFLTYLTKKADNTSAKEVLIDYDDPAKAPWYWEPKNRMNEFLTEPIIYPVQGVDVLMVSFMTPIINNNQFLGTTGIDYPIDFMQNKVKSAAFYDSLAIISIISNKGTFVAHSLNPKLINTGIQSIYANVNEQLKIIQNGQKNISEINDTLSICVPLIIGKTEVFWQVRMDIPMTLITADANKQMVFQLILGILLISISVIVFQKIVGHIIKPIESMAEKANAASEGDLTYELNSARTNDEVGLLADSFETMIDKLKNVVSDVVTSSENFVDSSKQLSASAQQISSGANEQAAASEEISSSIEEIAASVNQNAENSQHTEKLAANAVHNIQTANVSVQESILAMKTIIQKISVIKEIAEKTDLLAVNAAIESARAGESGKGFAVVASEVRKLAEHSQSAAKDIDEISASSLQVAENSGKLLSSVIPDIQNTAKLIQEITATSYEQNAGISQISNAIQQLTSVIQQNSALSEELAASSEELTSQATLLQDSISFFKVSKEQVSVSSERAIKEELRNLTELLETKYRNRQANDSSANKY